MWKWLWTLSFRNHTTMLPKKLRKKYALLVLSFYRKPSSLSSCSQAFCSDSLANGNNQKLKAMAYVEWLYHPINHIYCHLLTCCINFRKFNDSSWILQDLKKCMPWFYAEDERNVVNFNVYWEVTWYSQI